jgi:hypothetical protein
VAPFVKLLVADDNDGRRAQVCTSLTNMLVVREKFEVSAPNGDDLQAMISELEARRVSARTKHSRDDVAIPLDDADLLVVDYDLSELEGRTSMTGLDIAYLARCFSDCGYIVSLNQFGENTFDLSLSGYPETAADLDLGAAQLDNPGLWEEPASELEFRPWAWPVIPTAIDAFARRSASLVGQLERPAWDALGFTGHHFPALPASVTQYLSEHDPFATSVNEFVVSSGFALRFGDQQPHEIRRARIAAARLAKWLEQLVIPGQDVLVDAPHLALRFPSQLADNDDFEATAKSVYGPDSGLSEEHLGAHRYNPEIPWLTRPTWWWQEAAEDEQIAEVSDPFGADDVAVVFCEDTSRFVEPTDAREFRTELNTPFARRYVEGASGDRGSVRYRPESFFAS